MYYLIILWTSWKMVFPHNFGTDSVAAVSKQYLNHRVYRGAVRGIIGWKSTLPVNEAQPVPEAGAYW